MTTLREEETYRYLGILKADTIKQVEMKEKILKEYLRRMKKLLENKLYLIKRINIWTVPLEKDKGRTSANGPENKKTNNYAYGNYIPEMMLIDYTCQEKKVEEDLPTLKIALMNQYNSKTT